MRRRDVIVRQTATENRARYWQGHIRACESSGLSIAGYCRQEGLSSSSYHWWKRRLKACEGAEASEGTSVTPAFAEVPVAPSVSEAGPALEVVVRGGRAIRIGPGFDAETLARVLEVVERVGC